MNELPEVVVGIADEEILLGRAINFNRWLILIFGWLVFEYRCLLIPILLFHSDVQLLYSLLAIAVAILAGTRVVSLAIAVAIVAVVFVVPVVVITPHIPIVIICVAWTRLIGWLAQWFDAVAQRIDLLVD